MAGDFSSENEMREREQDISVEAWNTAMIDLGPGEFVSFDVNEEKLSSYLQSKLVPPVAADGPRRWRYSFDIRPRPPEGSREYEFFKNIAGLTVYDRATVIINVAGIWESLLPYERSVDKLLMMVCRTVAHETGHVKDFMNLELRKRAEQDKAGRKWWGEAGKALGVMGGVVDGLVVGAAAVRKREGVQKFTRREFLKLAVAGGMGLFAGTKVSDILKTGAYSVFDQFVDPSHRKSYQAEKEWVELKDMIKIKDYQLG